MNYKYEIEKKSKETRIIYIVCSIMSLLAVISNTNILIENMQQAFNIRSLIAWSVTIICVILFDIYSIYLGNLFETERKNFKEWKDYLLNNGIKGKGVVTEIKNINKNTYEFRIGYFSELQKNDIEFYTPIINIPNLEHNKKILCDVYESREYKPVVDYDAEVIKISGARIELTFNPFKLHKLVEKKYKREWFGNAIATNFYYESE